MTSEADDTTKVGSVKYYQLNNSNAGTFYDELRLKTMAIIRKKGWLGPFKAGATIPTDDEVEATGATAEEKRLHKENAEAYDQILMGCSGIPLGLVRRAKGDAREAMRLLDEKYAEQHSAKLTELLRDFTNCKLESKTADPAAWFIKLDDINDKLTSNSEDYTKKDYEIKAHMLANLPEGYSDVETKLQGQEDSLSVRDIENEISCKWKRLFKAMAESSKGSEEANKMPR
jgi:gag-polypeptide of LTR copia-type